MSYKNPGQKKMNQAGISTFWNPAYEISSNPNAANTSLIILTGAEHHSIRHPTAAN
jgi:hypothetical protein